MYLEAANGRVTIPQITNFGAVTNLDTADFTLTGNEIFVVKNDNEAAVTLEVMPADGDAYVSTSFAPGWNMELVKAIKTNTTITSTERGNLKWGV